MVQQAESELMQPDKPLFPQAPPLNPAKRAKSIRDSIAKGKIKRTRETDEILALLDQMVALEERTA